MCTTDDASSTDPCSQLLADVEQDVRDGGVQPGAGDAGGGEAPPLPHTHTGEIQLLKNLKKSDE